MSKIKGFKMLPFGRQSSVNYLRFMFNQQQPKKTIFERTKNDFYHSSTRSTRLNLNDFIARIWSKKSSSSFNHLFTSTSLKIKERLIDSLILFTSLLHIQSNVYFTLQLRRIAQLCLLYRRIYSPAEFQNVFYENIWKNCKLSKFFNKHCNKLVRDKSKQFCLLSFAACLANNFSWEENRITEQEFDELIKDFIGNHEKYAQFSTVLNNNNRKDESMSDDPPTTTTSTNDDDERLTPSDSSFMTVSCMEATTTTTTTTNNNNNNNNKENITVTDWEEIISRPNFHVWRKTVNNSASLYQYKVFGSFDDISAYSFYSVQKDLEYRKHWDKLVIKLDLIDVEPKTGSDTKPGIFDSRNEIVHWIMKYPYPMMNREYLYIRRSIIDFRKKFMILISRSVRCPDMPESVEHVRVFDYMSHMVIKPREDFFKPGFEFMLTYFDDPRASFPTPAYAWMAARGVPDFLEKLHQAALKFSVEKLSPSRSEMGALEELEHFMEGIPEFPEDDHDDNDDVAAGRYDTANEDEIDQSNRLPIPITNEPLDNIGAGGDDGDASEMDKFKRKLIAKLPEPIVDFDSLIWN